MRGGGVDRKKTNELRNSDTKALQTVFGYRFCMHAEVEQESVFPVEMCSYHRHIML